MCDGLGPYASIDVTTFAHGSREINQRLRQGWKLLSSQLVEEFVQGGAATRRRVIRHVPVAMLGRGFTLNDDKDAVAEEATEAGEDAMAQTSSVQLVAPGTDEDEASDDTDAAVEGNGTLQVRTGADAAAAEPETRRPPASRRQGVRSASEGRTVNDGRPGTTKVAGMRG